MTNEAANYQQTENDAAISAEKANDAADPAVEWKEVATVCAAECAKPANENATVAAAYAGRIVTYHRSRFR